MSAMRDRAAGELGPRPAPRLSRVDELLAAIDAAVEALRSSKGLRGHYPRAYTDLERHHAAARAVVEAASYEAARTVVAPNGLGTVRVATRRPLHDETAERALEAIGQAYGVPQ